jgi:glutamate-1-semialdehyde 2,1-aminomutase
MYGHQSAATLPEPFPQFLDRGRGCRVWDVDGREYVDFVCSFGPIVLGHAHRAVEAAVERQRALADCQNGPSPRMVELAERLVDLVPHADWAMFAKNGTDATTLALSIARSATGRRKVLVARGAYHGSAPWCTPRPAGTTPEDRADLVPFVYNDLGSVEEAVDQAGGDLAAVLVSAFRHDARFDQEECDPAFARGVRAVCDRRGAALVLDDVRAGFRLHLGGSWEPLGVRPDLSAYSKAIANGYPLAAVVGRDSLRDAAPASFRHGIVLVRRRAHGGRAGHDRGARGRAGDRADGSRRDSPPRRPRPAGARPRPPDHAERPRPAAVPDVRGRRGGGDLRPGERVHR